MAYAKVADYEARYGALSGESEESRVSVMLDDASLFIDELVEARDVDAAAKAAALKALCRDYVHRIYENEKAGTLSSITHTAGSFMEQQSFRVLKADFDAFARDYYGILGIRVGGVMFAWPGDQP